ncbi:MAG: PHP domain-containing protein [Eubacterium sp.]|nr:PHP domain-containing protein [Eubacterium sp.]
MDKYILTTRNPEKADKAADIKTAAPIYAKTDLHTHTCASGHGTNDRITDLAKEAARRHMETLGISDHGPATMGSAGLSYFRSLFLCERKRFGIKLLYGAEANILDKDGNLDIPDDILRGLDYCIISAHRPIYASGSAAENTRAYIRAMRHPGVRIIGHCDDSRFPVDYRELIQAARAMGVMPELNNVSLLPDSYRRDCRVNAAAMLRACEALSCPVILSSDSHGREHVGDVAEAEKLLREADFPKQLVATGL